MTRNDGTRPSIADVERMDNLEIAQQAFAETRDARADLPPESLITRYNFDVPTACAIAAAAAARVEELEAEMRAELGGNYDSSLPRLVRTFALGCFFAQVRMQQSDGPQPGEIDALVEETRLQRRKLSAVAKMFVELEMLPAEPVQKLLEGAGHLDLAADVTGYAALFEANWPKLEGRCPLRDEDLERAAEVASRLLMALEADRPEDAAAAEDDRNRAYTLLHSRYEELRRAVTYARWHVGDADEVAPKLRSRRA